MPRRSTSSPRQPSSESSASAGAATVATADSKQSAAPSLESLLKSCGALQSAIRQKSDDVETSETDAQGYDIFESDGIVDLPCPGEQQECVTDSNVEVCAGGAGHDSSGEHTLASVSPEMTASLNIVPILKLMREESRASIEELKASQAAAAAGQSAVLKALFEVISRSSSMRDNPGDSIEQKLIDFEERLGGFAICREFM